MKGCKTLVGTVLTVAAMAASSATAADPPGLGAWKLNVEKSSFSPGPPPKSLTTHFEPDGDGVKWKAERVAADGKASVATYAAKYDGKDYPIVGSPAANTIVLKRVDASTTERVNKKDGKVVTTERRVVAKDGKSYVTTVTGTTATGEVVSHRMHFERQ